MTARDASLTGARGPLGFTTIDYPGVISTVVNDISSDGRLVGVLLNSQGRVDGWVFKRTSLLAGSSAGLERDFRTRNQPLGYDCRRFHRSGCTDTRIHQDRVFRVFTFFTVPGSSGTFPTRINDSGVIVGAFRDRATGRFRGFQRTAAGIYTVCNHPNPAATGTYHCGISDQGRIVGSFSIASEKKVLPYSIREGVFVDEPYPSGFQAIRAMDVSDSGTVVGQLFSRNSSFPPDDYDPDRPTGYMSMSDGTSWQFGFPNAVVTGPLGINDNRQIVGFYEDPRGVRRGFLATY